MNVLRLGGKVIGSALALELMEIFLRAHFLYVTCSRAERSLALVAYSAQPQLVKEHVIREGWFEANEVQIGIPG
jgi:hypothetical protein